MQHLLEAVTNDSHGFALQQAASDGLTKVCVCVRVNARARAIATGVWGEDGGKSQDGGKALCLR